MSRHEVHSMNTRSRQHT